MHPIEDLEFWKERIKTAKSEQHSVYLVNDGRWKVIEEEHKRVAQEFCKGKVLDAGCGYGRASEWFDDYLGIDFSPDFIEKAKGKYPSKQFTVANLKELPFKDGEFDWALCASIRGMIIGNLGKEEWDKMDKELKRVCKHILYLEYPEPGEYEIA